MQRKKKPIQNLEEFLNSSKKDLHKEKYKKSLNEAIGEDKTKEIEDFKLNVGKFSLKTTPSPVPNSSTRRFVTFFKTVGLAAS